MADHTTPQPEAADSANLIEDRVTLDEVRDYMYTALRSLERFATELKSTVEQLDKRNPGDEWLEMSQMQLQKGSIFMEQQHALWDEQHMRMDAYIASVRALADELALQELRINPENDENGDKKQGDARIIHPELHRFKLEKQARIVGKYGGSPAMGGGMIMPRLARDAVLKATSSPAAREIQYSKVENKDAQYLAQVMQFKKEKKEAGRSGWQEELVTRRGETYLEEQQKKGVKPEKTPDRVILPADVRETLAKRQAYVDQAEEAALLEAAKAKAAQRAAPKLAGELADAFTKRQQATARIEAEQAEAAAEAAAVAAVIAGDLKPAPAHVTPLTAELSKTLQLRKAKAAVEAAEASKPQQQEEDDVKTPPPWAGSRLQPRTPAAATSTQPAAGSSSSSSLTPTPGMSPELLARLQRMKKADEE